MTLGDWRILFVKKIKRKNRKKRKEKKATLAEEKLGLGYVKSYLPSLYHELAYQSFPRKHLLAHPASWMLKVLRVWVYLVLAS